MKEKLLFVVSRYGKNMHGGAEWHCKQIAERLAEFYDVEVATTKAESYVTWENSFEEDTETLNGVIIRRFRTNRERSKDHAHTEASLRSDLHNVNLNVKWIIDQGPLSTDLTDFVEQNHQNYKKVIIFQYLYTPTFLIAKVVPKEKLIFVPLAHDEPQIKYEVFREVFRKSAVIAYNMEAEKQLAIRSHHVSDVKSFVPGVGIENVEVSEKEVEAFKKQFGLDKYIIYVGRVDPAKRVDVLINDFFEYKKANPSDLKLVLLGKYVGGEFPEDDDLVYTGFLPKEEDKFAAIKGAIALCNPSPFESLSLIVLEAFHQKVPVIVNAYCEVLKQHCTFSNGGLWYESILEFSEALNYMLENPDKVKQMGENGYKYARERYNWERVMNMWKEIVEYELPA